MNPQAGLKIRPFRHTHQNRETDKELYFLTKYLVLIAKLETISHLNHRNWEAYLKEQTSMLNRRG